MKKGQIARVEQLEAKDIFMLLLNGPAGKTMFEMGDGPQANSPDGRDTLYGVYFVGDYVERVWMDGETKVRVVSDFSELCSDLTERGNP